VLLPSVLLLLLPSVLLLLLPSVLLLVLLLVTASSPYHARTLCAYCA